MKLILTAALAAFLLAGAAQAGSAGNQRQEFPGCTPLAAAVGQLLTSYPDAEAHVLSAEEAARFDPASDAGAWLERPSTNVVAVVLASGGCVIFGTVMAPERLQEILAGE